MPLNGLKEEDKEPIIELFVKVSPRRRPVLPEPPTAPALRPPGRGGRRPLGAPQPRRPHAAQGKRAGAEFAPAPPAHCLGPTRAFPAPRPVEGAGVGPGPQKASTEGRGGGGGHRIQPRGPRRMPHIVPRPGGASFSLQPRRHPGAPEAPVPGTAAGVGPVTPLSPSRRRGARPHPTAALGSRPKSTPSPGGEASAVVS